MSLTHVSDMVDATGTRGFKNADDVNPHWCRTHCHVMHITPSKSPDAIKLCRCHRFKRVPEPDRCAGLDLTEHKHVIVSSNDINLSDVTAPVPFQNHQPLRLQILDGQGLTTPTEDVFGSHCNTVKDCRSGEECCRWGCGARSHGDAVWTSS
jgi:hypothetical protein